MELLELVPGLHQQSARSNTDKSMHIICMEDAFESLPHCVRQLGPWQGPNGGDIAQLKPHYRLQLAEQGFVVIYQKLAAFTAEPS